MSHFLRTTMAICCDYCSKNILDVESLDDMRRVGWICNGVEDFCSARCKRSYDLFWGRNRADGMTFELGYRAWLDSNQVRIPDQVGENPLKWIAEGNRPFAAMYGRNWLQGSYKVDTDPRHMPPQMDLRIVRAD